MNYTPNDLEHISIKKALIRGYSEDSVNEILDRVIEDYSSYIRENIEIKDRLALLNESLQHYKSIEESLQNTLIIAQQTSEDIKKNAYDKADNIVKEAEMKAQKMVGDAQQEVLKVKFEYEEMKKRLYAYKTKAETLLLSQMEVMKMMFDEKTE